ncbi:ribonucleotide reductase, alpha subunit [Xanthomonas phage BUDD]|nr:ribonucleotide reductase, alpha subunit [Xanthomonas phage BUDD]
MGRKEQNVTKRNGKREPYDVAKIQRQIEYACDGIPNVSQSLIELRMDLELYDGIKTSDIDELAVRAAVNLILSEEGHTNYQYVAGRLASYALRKEVYGQYEVPSLYGIVKNNVAKGLYTSELLEWYSEDDWNLIETFVDHTKDEKLSHAAVQQLIDKYLVRNRSTKEYVETPQIRYIVAAATAMHAEPVKLRMKRINEYYKQASNGEFTLPTPVLAGLGTPTKQFSSCVLLRSDDTLDSIFATGEMVAKYSAKRAGIGLEIGRLRPAGAPIRGGEIAHTGLTLFIKKWFSDMRSCSQGGIRNSSATLTYPIWHYEFEELIVLKNNQGTEENRVRHFDYSVVTCKYLWNRFRNKEMMTFFDPNEVPDLYEAYYRDQVEFVRLYEKYEKQDGLRKRQLNAADAFGAFLTERSDTGRIFEVYIDNVIDQGPVDSKTWPIYQSNLCQEILLPTRPFQRLEDEEGRIALCTLGSIVMGKFKKPQDMRGACRTLVRSLDNLLSYQIFLSPQAANANEDFRPLGIGITDLAHWHAQRGYTYGQPEALAEFAKWMEHIHYYCIEASIELAEERGPCKEWKNTSYAQGILPIDKRSPHLDEVHKIELTLDFDALRERVKVSGIRNGLLQATAPVESSSVVVDSSNGMALPKALISTKESKGSSLVQVVPEYEKLKERYEPLLMWNQRDCVGYLMTAALNQAFTDQSLSTDTFYNPAFFEGNKIPATLVAKNIMNYHRWGGKTLYYSLMNKRGSKDGLEEVKVETVVEEVVADGEDCPACTL